MFGNALQGWHIIIIVLVVLLLFGAPKLPGLARSIGQSMRIFRSEVKTMKDDGKADGDDAEADGETPESKSTPTPSTTKKPTTKS